MFFLGVVALQTPVNVLFMLVIALFVSSLLMSQPMIAIDFFFFTMYCLNYIQLVLYLCLFLVWISQLSETLMSSNEIIFTIAV